MTRKVLISGASVAGPTLAFWLARNGFEPTLVEHAAHVRGGGYAVDVRGTAVEVVKRMGIFDELFAARMALRRMTFVNHAGRKVASLRPSDLFSGVAADDIDIARGDLSGTLYAHTRDDVRYVFNDSIAGLDEDGHGVDVTFTSGEQRRFDLVVGADGIHSGTRALTFGAEDRFSRYLGYCVAIYRVPNHLGLDNEAVVYNVPGRVAAVGARTTGEAQAFLAFTHHDSQVAMAEPETRYAAVRSAFADDGWEVPTLVDALRDAEDPFFDTVSQIRMDTWSKGRIVLVGDSCFAPAFLSGQGTSLAIIGAYTLAHELAGTDDHQAAFLSYERRLRAFVERNQALALRGSSSVLPKTERDLRTRNRLMKVLPLLKLLGLGGFLSRETREVSTAFTLPRAPRSLA